MELSKMARASLFDTFHASEFKGYTTHLQTPKEAIKEFMALFT
jgi:hypothetical protein